MAKNLTELTARTATADSDLIHVNSGGTDYKETKKNFLQGSFAIHFSSTSTLTSQIDALGNDPGTYVGYIAGYGHQTETGLPANTNFFVTVYVYAATVKHVVITRAVSGEAVFDCYYTGSWGAWVQRPSRAELTTINNSLANRLVDISSYFSVGTGISVSQSSVQAFYDPYNHSVRFSLFVSASATFNTTTDIFTITNSAYRPTANTNIIGMITANGNVYPYRGTVYTNGGIRQIASGICTSAYFAGEYKVA